MSIVPIDPPHPLEQISHFDWALAVDGGAIWTSGSQSIKALNRSNGALIADFPVHPFGAGVEFDPVSGLIIVSSWAAGARGIGVYSPSDGTEVFLDTGIGVNRQRIELVPEPGVAQLLIPGACLLVVLRRRARSAPLESGVVAE